MPRLRPEQTRKNLVLPPGLEPADHLWWRVDRSAGDGCWPWVAAKARGYGYVRLNGRLFPAHRVAWEVHNQARILPGFCVMHSCDNRACCNPAHLSLGTHQENMSDMWQKERGYRGGNAGHKRRYSEAVRAEVRTEMASGKTAAQVCRERGWPRSTIGNWRPGA